MGAVAFRNADIRNKLKQDDGKDVRVGAAW